MRLRGAFFPGCRVSPTTSQACQGFLCARPSKQTRGQHLRPVVAEKARQKGEYNCSFVDALPLFRLPPSPSGVVRDLRVPHSWLFRDQVTPSSASKPRQSMSYTDTASQGLHGPRRKPPPLPTFVYHTSGQAEWAVGVYRLAWRRTQRTTLSYLRVGDGLAHLQYNLAMCLVEPPWGRLGAAGVHRSWGGSWNPALGGPLPSPTWAHLEKLAASADIIGYGRRSP